MVSCHQQQPTEPDSSESICSKMASSSSRGASKPIDWIAMANSSLESLPEPGRGGVGVAGTQHTREIAQRQRKQNVQQVGEAAWEVASYC